MITKKVSRLGKRQRIIYLPVADFKKGDSVRLNPKGTGTYLTRKVMKMGSNLIVTIPVANWDRFPYHSVVQVYKVVS